MALFTPSQSPAVVVKEIDATGGVPNVQTSTGAIVGKFKWGPVDQRILISNETELVNTFGAPDSGNTIDFHNASNFLRYSNTLQTIRMVDSDGQTDGTDGKTRGLLDKNKGSVNARSSIMQDGGIQLQLYAPLQIKSVAHFDGGQKLLQIQTITLL